MRMIGVYLDDPDLVATDKLRSYACVNAGKDIAAEAPLERRTIDGGDYAVLRHKGPYADMYKAYRWLYAEWLPASGRQLRDAVMFEEYLNNPTRRRADRDADGNLYASAMKANVIVEMTSLIDCLLKVLVWGGIAALSSSVARR